MPAWINCATASPRRSRIARNAGFEYNAIVAASSGPIPLRGSNESGPSGRRSNRVVGILTGASRAAPGRISD
ncbi:MAG TPA: hypothetical protein DIT76_07345 [Spartobacteria bacterium]|nr:hypothetical protein [Spartobacteria bacterium]HCP91841.1 hypothetical protein [Spartobacteria bacterium]